MIHCLSELGGPYFRENDLMRYIGGIAKRHREESSEAA